MINAMLGTLVAGVLAIQEAKPIVTLTDHKHNCVYVIGGSDDGLHIAVTGGDHCYQRIKVDGQSLNLGRRI